MMRNIVIVFGIFFTSLHLHAQVAPDFNVTDIDGQVHQLYADYLDQGKTVMIKIFFTTCPPCNSIAPLMEPFYQEWGAGQHDVQFFEMTDKSFDVNSLVEAYADSYGETFPAISMQGGSLEAVQPYKSGQFGPWLGTPTFVVIAPNGTVQFDVSGSGNQATIDAIDAAISATGALKPGQIPLAPDFAVTDIVGQPHQLYADYLDLGKTVVLVIFNTTCAPCQSIAPLLEPLNEEWGSGNHDVVFFDMTDQLTDNNSLVSDFQEEFEHSYYGISNEGGSVAAVQPYKDGTFGPWVATPTFVVIAPDGSVQYDVDGSSNQETIEEIDLAIAATGAEKPPQGEVPVEVSGLVQFLQGSGGVGNAFVQVVDVNSTVIKQDTTDVNGNFNLAILLSEVQPDWQLKVVKEGEPINGINAVDLIRMQKHLLILEPLTDPLAKLAIDVNGSGTISALDIVGVLKLLLGITQHFPDQQSWITVPSDTDFGVPTQHPPVIPSYSIPLQAILDGERQPTFFAVKKGDANGTANPQ